jgi:hypothetical protein
MYHSDGRADDEVAVHVWNTKEVPIRSGVYNDYRDEFKYDAGKYGITLPDKLIHALTKDIPLSQNLIDIRDSNNERPSKKQSDDIYFEPTGDGGFIANYKPAFSDGIMYLHPSKFERHQKEKYNLLESNPNEIDELEELYINQKNKDEDFMNRANNRDNTIKKISSQ